MKYFIEKYYSSYTHNTLYSKPTKIDLLDWTLKQTTGQKYLRTVQVIFLDNVKERNGYYFMPDLRLELPRIPSVYKSPSLYNLTGRKEPRKLTQYERARAIKVDEKQLQLL